MNPEEKWYWFCVECEKYYCQADKEKHTHQDQPSANHTLMHFYEEKKESMDAYDNLSLRNNGPCSCLTKLKDKYCGSGFDPYIVVSVFETIEEKKNNNSNSESKKAKSSKNILFQHQTKTVFGGGPDVIFCSDEHESKKTFSFSEQNNNSNKFIRFVAWDEDLVGADDLIGMETLNITEFFKYGQKLNTKVWTSLSIKLKESPNGACTGDTSFLMSYDPKKNQFTLVILSALDLVNPDIGDPDDESNEVWTPIAVIIAYVALGWIYYGYVEGWRAVDIVYFAFVTMTTVGYGDHDGYIFQETYGFTAAYVLLGFSAGGFAISQLILAISETVKREAGDLMTDHDAINSGASEEESTEDTPDKPGRCKNFGEWLNDLPKSLWICLFMFFAGTLVASFSGSITGPDHVVKNYGESFYFVIVTMTTVGFGDYSPITDSGKWFAIFWLSTGTVAMANLLASMMNREIAANEKRKRERILQNAFKTDRDFIAFDEDGDNKIEELEFVTTMLVKLKACEPSHIDEIRQAFASMDEDGSGSLTMQEIKDYLNPDKNKKEEEF